MILVYTIGHTENYNKALLENAVVNKLGKTDDYEGGIIFREYEQAEQYIQEQDYQDLYSVYGVYISSEKDVKWNKDGTGDLLVTSRIVPVRDPELQKKFEESCRRVQEKFDGALKRLA
jgi:hypothetical protein